MTLNQTMGSLYPSVGFDTTFNAPQGNWLQRAAASLGNQYSQNPEKFAIAADMVGSRLAPDNPFAGVGTSIAQSSLASKEKTKIESTNEKLMKLIEGLTGKDQPGGTKLSFTKNKSGGLDMDGKWNIGGLNSPTSTAPTTKTPGEAQRGSDGGGGIDIHKVLGEAATKTNAINAGSRVWGGGR